MAVSETQLCSEFMAAARERGWRVSPETEGWDVLMERPDGLQVGLQAKRGATMAVLRQALEAEGRRRGPDVHGVLVPTYARDFFTVAAACGLVVVCRPYHCRGEGPSWDGVFTMLMEQVKALPLREHAEPAWMPDCGAILMPAGTPSPSTITPWKVEAVRLAMRLRAQGRLTAKDFGTAAMRRAFVSNGWVRGVKRDGEWVWEADLAVQDGKHGLPDRRWPEIKLAIQRGGA